MFTQNEVGTTTHPLTQVKLLLGLYNLIISILYIIIQSMFILLVLKNC